MSAILEEDLVIRNRLGIDERYFRRCLKKLASFQLALSGHDLDELKNSLESFLVDLSYCETSVIKHRLVNSMNKNEVKVYDGKVNEIDSLVQKTRLEIDDLKKELEASRKERKNKMEYDKAAVAINSFPTRDELQKEYQTLSFEVEQLKQKQTHYYSILELRKKHFESLVLCALDLKDIIAKGVDEPDLDTMSRPCTPIQKLVDTQELNGEEIEEEEGILEEDSQSITTSLIPENKQRMDID